MVRRAGYAYLVILGRWRVRWSAVWLLAILLAGFPAWAQSIDKLPPPTGYVNDFAGVIDADSHQRMEALCTELDQKAHAQVAVVTVNSLDGDTAADYANRLEEKWKVGAKATDKGVLMLFAVNDRQRWIEVGYGLEGVLNDAKVGDIGRSMVPQLREGQYGPAIYGGLKQISDDVAADAHVTLTEQPAPRLEVRRQPQGSTVGALLRVIFFIVVLILIFGARRGGGGGGGLGWFLLGNFLGSQSRGRGGWGGGDNGGGWGGGDGGGGFGGFGGGSSGGGGAGGDW